MMTATMIRQEILDSDLTNFIGSIYVSEDYIIVVKDRAVSPEEAMDFIDNQNGEWGYRVIDDLKWEQGIRKPVILMDREAFDNTYTV